MSEIQYQYESDRPLVVKRRISFTLRPSRQVVPLRMGQFIIQRFGITERIEWKSKVFELRDPS